MRSPPGTSPTPVRPALSFRMTRLRVKKGPCAPLRLSSMESWPATGVTCMSTTVGVAEGAVFMSNLQFEHTSRAVDDTLLQMNLSRRDLGKMAVAALPATRMLAKLNSKFGGVQIGIN